MKEFSMHAYDKDKRDEQSSTPSATPQPQQPAKKPSRRGFASMDKAKQKEIARKGGRAAHLKGTAHEFTSEEARMAGRKGGVSVSRDRLHMAEIGRGGGQARSARLKEKRAQEEAAKRLQQANEGSASVGSTNTAGELPPAEGRKNENEGSEN